MRHRNTDVEVFFFFLLKKKNVSDLVDWYSVVVVLENIINFECGCTGKFMVEMSFSWCSA